MELGTKSKITEIRNEIKSPFLGRFAKGPLAFCFFFFLNVDPFRICLGEYKIRLIGEKYEKKI